MKNDDCISRKLFQPLKPVADGKIELHQGIIAGIKIHRVVVAVFIVVISEAKT